MRCGCVDYASAPQQRQWQQACVLLGYTGALGLVSHHSEGSHDILRQKICLNYLKYLTYSCGCAVW
jgi:hypothetical protein